MKRQLLRRVNVSVMSYDIAYAPDSRAVEVARKSRTSAAIRVCFDFSAQLLPRAKTDRRRDDWYHDHKSQRLRAGTLSLWYTAASATSPEAPI